MEKYPDKSDDDRYGKFEIDNNKTFEKNEDNDEDDEEKKRKNKLQKWLGKIDRELEEQISEEANESNIGDLADKRLIEEIVENIDSNDEASLDEFPRLVDGSYATVSSELHEAVEGAEHIEGDKTSEESGKEDKEVELASEIEDGDVASDVDSEGEILVSTSSGASDPSRSKSHSSSSPYKSSSGGSSTDSRLGFGSSGGGTGGVGFSLPSSPAYKPESSSPSVSELLEKSSSQENQENNKKYLLIGGVVGYLVGKRSGMNKAENNYTSRIQNYDIKLSEIKNQILQRESQIRELSIELSSVSEYDVRQTLQNNLQRRVPETLSSKTNETQLKSNKKERVRIDKLNFAEQESIAENIVIDGISAKKLFEIGSIDRSGLIKVVEAYLNGKDIKSELNKNILGESVIRDRAFEREPGTTTVNPLVSTIIDEKDRRLGNLATKSILVDKNNSQNLDTANQAAPKKSAGYQLSNVPENFLDFIVSDKYAMGTLLVLFVILLIAVIILMVI